MFDALPLLVSVAAIGLAGAAPPPAVPLKLEVSTTGGTSIIRLIGESPVACTASYRLEVTDSRGGNRSVSGGKATIAPGQRQTLATVTLGPDSARTTTAKLEVQPCGGASYEQAWSTPRS
jgi:hypothetical protein